MSEPVPIIRCDNLVRIYQRQGVEVMALQGLDLAVDRAEVVAVVGASGSGKSTLLAILSGQDVPTAGAVQVAGADLLAMGPRERRRYRRHTVGFIWQQTTRNLLGYLTAEQNVTLPMGLAGVRRRDRHRRATELLELVGAAADAGRRPAELSGRQQQRVAIAVALANDPQVLLADEPTGELDSDGADGVFEAMHSAHREVGVTVLVVTHDAMVAERVNRTVAIRDGRIATEVLRRRAQDAGTGTGTGTGTGGGAEVIAEEYAVLDRSGRLQLPPEFTDVLGMRKLVRLALEPDHIGVWPDAVDREPGR